MAVNVHSSGVFPDITTGDGGSTLVIPLSSIQYGTASTLSAANATGDYRALMRGITQSYYNFIPL